MVIYCLIKWRTKFPAHHEQQQQKCQSFTAIDNDSSYLCVCVCVCSVSQQPPKVSNGRLLPSSDANHRFACSRASTHSRLASKGAIGLKNLCAIFLRLVKAKNRFYSLLQLFVVVVVVCVKQTKKKKILFCYTYNKYHWELESLLVIVGVFSVPIMFVRPKKQKLCNSAPVGLQFRWPTTICVVFSFFCSSHSSICEKWMKMTLEASK